MRAPASDTYQIHLARLFNIQIERNIMYGFAQCLKRLGLTKDIEKIEGVVHDIFVARNTMILGMMVWTTRKDSDTTRTRTSVKQYSRVGQLRARRSMP